MLSNSAITTNSTTPFVWTPKWGEIPGTIGLVENNHQKVIAGKLDVGESVARIDGVGTAFQVTLQGNRWGVFRLSGPSIQIARNQTLRPGSTHAVQVKITSPSGVTTTLKLELVIADTAVTITTPENAAAGQVLGKLPPLFRLPRVQFRELAGDYGRWVGPDAPPGAITIQAFWYESVAGISQPIQIGPRGQLIANPSTDPRAVTRGQDMRFNFERSSPTRSGQTAYEVTFPSGRTSVLMVNLVLQDVKEATEITDQELSLTEEIQVYTWPRDFQPSANQKLTIIGGNMQSWFSVVDTGVTSMGRFRFRCNDYAGLVALMNSADFAVPDLIVALEEDGHQVGTARMTLTRYGFFSTTPLPSLQIIG